MRAVAVPRFRALPESMDLPIPKIGAREILVRVEYAGINPFDWKIAEGIFEGSRPHVFPLVLGVDAAGRAEEVGKDVQVFHIGDPVFGQFLHDPVGTGTYAEFTTVPEGIGITGVPPGMNSVEAAALPTAGMTALASLDALGLSAGASLVIVGASGGVGSFATELATAAGIRVTAVARSNSAARLRSLGAIEVVDPATEDGPSLLRRRDPSKIDGLLDLMSDRPGFARWASAVRSGGAAVTTTFSADVESQKRAGIRAVNVDLHPTSELLRRVAETIVSHRLKVPVERRVRLNEAAAALAELKAGRAAGKTVVDIRA